MSNKHEEDDDLAYGEETEHTTGRGFVGDVIGRLEELKQYGNNMATDAYKDDHDAERDEREPLSPSEPTPAAQPSWRMSLATLQNSLSSLSSEVKNQFSGGRGAYEKVDTTQDAVKASAQHRYGSFAAPSVGNNAKWFVDGCAYFWAVSIALEQAKESIWILDWWLSPELYLRRPPSRNYKYRLDRLLKNAAERGCKVNIIVYKEVTQALTLASAHTKHALEELHPNISVFRHPDHIPDVQSLGEDVLKDFKDTDFSIADLVKLPGETLKTLFGKKDETVLFWAHHEKLLLVDGSLAFMGGLDLCFGRWDTNQHSIADVHPSNLDEIIFPGQDYNNARIYDFQDVGHWQNNKLDRTKNSRMGWSDVSICITGPAVVDLQHHFTQRWNFIFDEKYEDRSGRAYERLPEIPTSLLDPAIVQHGLRQAQKVGWQWMNRFSKEVQKLRQGDYEAVDGSEHEESDDKAESQLSSTVDIQVLRSCSKWSHGVSTEQSIQDAYIKTIHDSNYFIYIENQFFITATSQERGSVQNQVGAALVERISRAAKSGDSFKVIVVMPAIPAFTGDLRQDASLSTRAIMEFQYQSICRGGHSIYEKLAEQDIDASKYIKFYNLRSYDRINSSSALQSVEKQSGVAYEDARKEHDGRVGGGFADQGEGTDASTPDAERYQKYQEASKAVLSGEDSNYDSVASCYMLGGPDIRSVPWDAGGTEEIDAFVSEELYIHSKLLIADDRVVIIGSANLNDRSLMGTHDSEIAVRIEDTSTVASQMNGQSWDASRFAAALRRQLFRKHIGLLKAQNMREADQNYLPLTSGVGNEYDWGSPEDLKVEDPLSDSFTDIWEGQARANTEAFVKVFHPVPVDSVTTWKEYDEYYERFFKEEKGKPQSLWKWGHVVAENFSAGSSGIEEVKNVLGAIRGNLVEMPLNFLKDEDIAKHGLTLNELTEDLYT